MKCLQNVITTMKAYLLKLSLVLKCNWSSFHACIPCNVQHLQKLQFVSSQFAQKVMKIHQNAIKIVLIVRLQYFLPLFFTIKLLWCIFPSEFMGNHNRVYYYGAWLLTSSLWAKCACPFQTTVWSISHISYSEETLIFLETNLQWD